ncbi:MAG: DUF2238 domain-containing protein [Verrucomicrobiota bacterium]|nr:DUF2238 domain-containing protein [Verrucomicrobiota bacterium]
MIALAVSAAVLAWSGWRPYDRFTWWLETAPGIAGFIVLALTCRRFQFTPLCYALIAAHFAILCIGGHYTYARVPFFDTLRDVFGFSRNHYDRLGHFAQGFVPAIIARELLLRLDVVRRKNWIPFFVVCICLAISAFYELIEWWVAIASGTASNDFIGSQGDIWDTQWDMFTALIGATCAFVFLSRIHDAALQKLERR